MHMHSQLQLTLIMHVYRLGAPAGSLGLGQSYLQEVHEWKMITSRLLQVDYAAQEQQKAPREHNMIPRMCPRSMNYIEHIDPGTDTSTNNWVRCQTVCFVLEFEQHEIIQAW